MATKKKVAKKRALVKIHETSVNKVKKAVIGTGKTIGDFYEEAAEVKLKTK